MDISEDIATTLVANGFLTTEGIADVDVSYLQEVTALDEENAQKIWAAAKAASTVEDAGE